LAEEVKCKAVDWHARHNVSFDVLINCTPVGMHPNVDESPCHFSILKPGVTVFDTIYRPETTLLLREARTRGCDTITGVDMFVRQAARQIEMFIGQTPDQAAMRDIMRRALSPLTKAFSEESEKSEQQEPTTEHAILPANSMPSRIILIGYRGTGKTTVGRLLAAQLGWAFADSDDAIESTTGRSIAETFAAEGEAGFRKHEADALGELSKREAIVIATGGGAVLRPENRELLRSAGFIAWLTARPETIRDRLRGDPRSAQRRPKLTPAGGIEEIRQLLAVRDPLYREIAHFIADADAPSPEAVAAAILKAWPGSNSSPSSSGA
jgi:shikimate kinase